MKLYIVSRGAKESTEQWCLQIAQELVGNHNVVLLNEPSFAKAHIKSMEIGANLLGFDYVIFLDADILLFKENFYESIKNGIENLKDKKFYMLNYQVFDRQCISPVYGVHLYNINTLKKAIDLKSIALNSQKPETAVCKEMAKRGYKTYTTQELIGFHGYEQYYLDLYRTAFVRGVKYKGHWDFYLSTFYKNKKKDLDFFWSYQGLIDGILYFTEGNKNASLSKSNYIGRFNKHLLEYNLKEKEELIDIYNSTIIQRDLNNINPLYEENKGWLTPLKVGFNETNEFKKIIRKIYKKVKAKLKAKRNE